jgi:hypothetical protein
MREFTVTALLNLHLLKVAPSIVRFYTVPSVILNGTGGFSILRCLSVASLNTAHSVAQHSPTAVLLIALSPTVISKKTICAHNAVRLKRSFSLAPQTIARDGMKSSQPARPNPALNPVRFALWTLRDEAAQRRLALR